MQNTQANKILEILKDGNFHCTTEFYAQYMADPRRRLCDLQDRGYQLENRWCQQHDHKMKQWRLIGNQTLKTAPRNDFKPVVRHYTAQGKEFCCLSYWNGGSHSEKCFKREEVKVSNALF